MLARNVSFWKIEKEKNKDRKREKENKDKFN